MEKIITLKNKPLKKIYKKENQLQKQVTLLTNQVQALNQKKPKKKKTKKYDMEKLESKIFNSLEGPISRTPKVLSSFKPTQKNLSQRMNQLISAVNRHQSSYLKAIIMPELSQPARIPMLYPLPTLANKMKSTIQFTTNVLGNAAVLINPWFLADSTNVETYILINAAATLDLNGAGVAGFAGISMNSKFPATDISAYRLVGASVRCYSNSSALNRGGKIVGGIVTRAGQADSYALGGLNNPFSGAAANSSSIDQALYCTTCDITAGDSFRAIYIPFDPTFEMFTALGSGRAIVLSTSVDQFYWNFYVRGPASQPMTLEIVWHFELEPMQESFAQTLVEKTSETVEMKNHTLTNLSQYPQAIVQSITDLSLVEKMEDSMNDEAYQQFSLQFEEDRSNFVSNRTNKTAPLNSNFSFDDVLSGAKNVGKIVSTLASFF